MKGQKGHFSPKVHVSDPGNEVAAAAFQPLNRGGNSHPPWGQNSNQIQVQMISEICQQVMHNLMTKQMQICPNYQ